MNASLAASDMANPILRFFNSNCFQTVRQLSLSDKRVFLAFKGLGMAQTKKQFSENSIFSQNFSDCFVQGRTLFRILDELLDK